MTRSTPHTERPSAEPASAAVSWPDGFTPTNPLDPTDAAGFAAVLDAGSTPVPKSTFDPIGPVPDAGRFRHVLAFDERGGESWAEIHADDRAALVRALASPDVLALLDLDDHVPTGVPVLPLLVHLPPGTGEAGHPYSATARPDERAYVCGLSRVPFALPEASPIPALAFTRVGADGDVADDARVRGQAGATYTDWRLVHPSLVKAGPRAVAQALARAASEAVSEVSRAFEAAATLLALSGGMAADDIGRGWPGDAYAAPRRLQRVATDSDPSTPLLGVRTFGR